jgi:uncharacterized protein YxeA
MNKNLEDKGLRFNTKEEISKSIRIIEEEYTEKLRRKLFYTFGLIVFFVIFIFIADEFEFLYNDTSGVNVQYLPLRLSVFWITYSFCVYLIFYFLKMISIKQTPTLIKYLKNEIGNLDLEIKNRNLSEKSFILLTSLSLFILLLIDLRIIKVYHIVVDFTIQGILIFLLSLNLIIPIIIGLFYDRFRITLKNNYYIRLDIQYSFEKQNTQTISVFMTSNRLTSKMDRMGIKLYKKIAQYRWLPNKNSRVLTKKKLTPFLRFFEYSSLVNFQQNLLNLALALKDFEKRYFRENLVFYQDKKVRRRTLESCKYQAYNVNNACFVFNI